MHNGVCQHCGAKSVYRGKLDDGLHLHVATGRGLSTRSAKFPIECLVCSACGALEFMVAASSTQGDERHQWFEQSHDPAWRHLDPPSADERSA